MKKLIVLVVILMGCYNAFGQKVYCELVGTSNLLGTKVTVEVDFGQKQWGAQYLVNSDGKPLKFNSMIDAMNEMATLGWEFETAYIIGKAPQFVYHWLLSKQLSEGEFIDDGFTTRKQYKDAQKRNDEADLLRQ